MPKRSIAIIGGGVAGLAAAVTLANADANVTVFETNSQLGGRAKGIQYQGLPLDNGQHILLGAYRETLRLLKLTHAPLHQTIQRIPLALSVLDLAQQRYFRLKAPTYLPAPLHILAGLLTAQGLSLRDKWCALRMMVWMKWHAFTVPQDETLAAFLSRQHQTKTLIQSLWEPLCLAALNTPLQQASAQVFLNVLRDSFNQKTHDADVLLAKTDLTTLLSAPWADFVTQQSGRILTSTTVKAIRQTEHGYALTTQEEELVFSHVMIATGPHQVKYLTKTLPLLNQATEQFAYQPITTVYLQYNKTTRLSQSMLGMVNSTSQWVFDRGQVCGQDGLLAVVISAHADLEMDQTTLAETIHTELTQAIPQLEKPIWHKVVTEKRATFSCDVNLARPNHQTAYPNLYLAGDYTAGDYPATIEGAVRSGIAAANLILQDN
ncbi:hydroxysqualene dehydroxylase HpnE [Methylotenera sp. N17]|uniref:hydroxysqualene dehydroxylase HpnE n=1 Tax=Methylotenera sp. N17 TaxID=1502761 RepID=UPI00064910B0|nr:hydroxysqualene dehydroxylase HpnE [Methylotenera sp. N17]